MDNYRGSVRTTLKMRLRIEHPLHGELMVSTRDVSEGGVFVLIDQNQGQLKIGERVRGQVQGLPIEAPVLSMEVIRVEPMGVGLRFLTD